MLVNDKIKKLINYISNVGKANFMKMVFSYLLKNNPFLLYYCSVRNKHYDQNICIDKLVDYCFSACGGIIKPFQKRSEILTVLNILDKIRPKFMLEVGTSLGGTLFLFSRIAADDAMIISLDKPGIGFPWGYPSWRIPFYKSFELSNQQIYLMRANSQEEPTLLRVKEILKNKEIDFLFLDGNHSYEGVKRDFELYSQLVRINGLIGFHDIIPSNLVGDGVRKYWDEIKPMYKNMEIVADLNQDGFGIGLILKK